MENKLRDEKVFLVRPNFCFREDPFWKICGTQFGWCKKPYLEYEFYGTGGKSKLSNDDK
jgi:hypothetical protein